MTEVELHSRDYDLCEGSRVGLRLVADIHRSAQNTLGFGPFLYDYCLMGALDAALEWHLLWCKGGRFKDRAPAELSCLLSIKAPLSQ